MSSRLINVRLSKEQFRKVESLRESGVNVSQLVRDAIDQKFAEVAQRRKPQDVDAIMKLLDERYPISKKDFPPRTYSVHDRKQAAAAIVRHLKRKKSRAA